jgi:lysozyme
MSETIPQAVLDLLDPNMVEHRLLKSFSFSGDTYFLIVDADEDGGGESFVLLRGAEASLIASGTTVFPLPATLPDPVRRAFSEFPTQGPPTAEAFVVEATPLALLSQAELNDRVAAAAQAADGTLDTDVPGTDHGNLACAYAVNKVVKTALGREIGGGLSTDGMFDVLVGRHNEVTESTASGGSIIISPTEGKNHGHVGIVATPRDGRIGDDTVIFSNRSSAHMFGHKFTLGLWRRHYHDQKQLQVRFFDLNPARFASAISIREEVFVAFRPPGLNAIVDIYVGDSRAPDFARIKQAGIVAFIHKATDPIHRLDPELYMQRKSAAKAAGLLWGSYHFGRSGDGVAQANAYLDFIKPDDQEFVCLDFEFPESRPDTVMPLDEAENFVNRVRERLGKPPFLYGGNYLREQAAALNSSALASCPLWFADYRRRPAPQIPTLWKTYSFWQYRGDVPSTDHEGLPTLDLCDRSVFNGTLEELKAAWRCRG